ncbi:hypothetical protein [Burkholderia cepacia]|uniref:hypothetical protein n=1 Tax=Burkholderia cepacia TaxID=292 RepID=UPI002AB7DDA7|nr:hypothetical protein [Burkholderia cepacia]
MVVKKRNVGDADQFAIIRAFTRVPRDASASFPDAVRGFGRAAGSSRKCAWRACWSNAGAT